MIPPFKCYFIYRYFLLNLIAVILSQLETVSKSCWTVLDALGFHLIPNCTHTAHICLTFDHNYTPIRTYTKPYHTQDNFLALKSFDDLVGALADMRFIKLISSYF